MRRNRNYLKLFSLVFIILFCFAFQTIVYSAFSSTMTITGTAHARIEADVRITDFRLASTNNATSSYEEFGKDHIVAEIDLSNSSSYITYYLEITNYGSVDVGIFDITGLPSGVSYSIKDYNLKDKICDENNVCNSFIKKTYEITLTTSVVYAGSVQLEFYFRVFHKVTYTGITNNNYPTEVIDGGNLNITFKEDLKRVQVLSNGMELGYYKEITSGQSKTISNITNDVEVKLKPYVAKLVSGDINTVGSEIAIGDEHFYVISSDETNVNMLSKYNLHVGNQYTGSVTALTNPTGKQDKDAIGWFSGGGTTDKPYIGTIAFSSTNYWSSNVSEYPAYVYDSNSTLYSHVENYKNYLTSLGATISDARLIKVEELETLGCSMGDYSCSGAPEWVYSTSYWSGSADYTSSVWYVNSSGSFGDGRYSGDNGDGLRPVISISKSLI